MKDKAKKILIIAVTIIAFIACIVIYWQSITKIKTKNKNNIKSPEDFEILALKSDIKNLEDQVRSGQFCPQIQPIPCPETFIVKDEFSKILLQALILQQKLQSGGIITAEVTILNLTLNKIPAVYNMADDLKNINALLSYNQILEEFNKYIRYVKSQEVESRGSIWGKIKAFISKYITILNSNNPTDKTLLKVESLLKNSDFIRANYLISSIPFKNDFTTHLENSAKVQLVIMAIEENVSRNIN